MFLPSAIFCAALSLATTGYSLNSVSYDFESLGNGSLTGQDNWLAFPPTPTDTLSIQAGSGANTSKVAGTNGGRNVRNFGSSFFSGTETTAIIQFSAQPGGVHMALAADGNNNGSIGDTNGELSPLFGFDTSSNFFISPKAAGGQFASAITSTRITANNGVSAGLASDWYQVRLVIDFNANTGAGSGSLFYLNTTNGDTTFTAVSGLQNINLGLNFMTAGANPAAWNAIYLRANGGGFIDNLSVTAIPEPATVGIVLGGFALLVGVSIRSRKRNS